MNLSTILSTIFDFVNAHVPAWAQPFMPFLESAFQDLMQSKPDATVALTGDSPDSVKAGLTKFLTDLVEKMVPNPIAKAILVKVIALQAGKLLDMLYNKYLASAVNAPTVPEVPVAPGILAGAGPITIDLDEVEFKKIVASHLGIAATHCACPGGTCQAAPQA